MEFRVEESPGDVLAAAEGYFLACRYTVKRPGETEISAYTSKKFSWLLLTVCIIGVAIPLYFWHLVESHQSVNLSVRNLEGGTLLVTEGSDVSRILFKEWIGARFQAL